MFEDFSGPNDATVPQQPFMPAQPGHQYVPPTSPLRRSVRPEQLIRRPASSAPSNPFNKLAYLWHSDPAYKVLMIAIATIVVSGIVGLIIVSSLFNQASSPSSPPPSGQSAVQVPAGAATPSPTTAPTPTPQPTPILIPTVMPTIAPTPTVVPIQNTPLSLQLGGIPNQVNNNTSVNVTVTTSMPNVNVKLAVTYNVAPGIFMSGTHTSDANGNVTIHWRVNVFSFQNTASARVTAVAQDQNGQAVTSPAVTVQINVKH